MAGGGQIGGKDQGKNQGLGRMLWVGGRWILAEPIFTILSLTCPFGSAWTCPSKIVGTDLSRPIGGHTDAEEGNYKLLASPSPPGL